jgi:DNA-binding XRE family transcriptional regulator
VEQDKAHLRGDLRGAKDGAGRFLSDLRALRAKAGLDQGELAARAHYPRDVITAAESGRVLPELPVLAAYVRGCGGFASDFSEWEDRWRAVTGSTASPVRQTRVAGLSGAASAGARISEASCATPAEGQGSAVVVAALHRFAARMAQPTAASRNSEPTGEPVPESAGEPVPELAAGQVTVPAGPEPPARDGIQGTAGTRRADTFGRVLAVLVLAAVLFCLFILMR